MVPSDLIPAPDYMQTTDDIFVTEQLITPVTEHLTQPHVELGSFITPPTILNSDFTVPEPATTPSWIQEEEDKVNIL